MKRRISAFLVATICIVSIFSVLNNEVKAKEYLQYDTKYLNDISIIDVFIKGIEETERVTIDEDNIIDYTIEDEVITLTIANETDGFTIYHSLSDEEQIALEQGIEPKNTLTKILGYVMKAYSAGKYICKAIESLTDTDVCSLIGQALLDTMTPNVEYKVQSYFYKNPNCVPMHSQQCNMYPNAYWKTTVVRA